MDTDTRDAFSISEFCRRHGLGRTSYYELKKTGEAPREMRIGGRILISREAAEQWRRRMEAKTEAA